MGQIEKDGRNFIGYEYKEIASDRSKSSMYMDGYQNFGWELAENQVKHRENGIELLRFKRDRKIMNKTELTRLERNFEDCMNQIEALERSKVKKANLAALTIGMLGTMFMAGSTFAVTASPPMIWLCVVLAIPGFAGWIAPYFCHRAMVKRRTMIVNPLIEEQYDEIYKICEKGSHLLGN